MIFPEAIFLKIIGVLLTLIAGWMGKNLGAMARSVQQLNVKMAVVIEKLESHEHRINRLERAAEKGSKK